MEKMYNKKNNALMYVYHFTDDNLALCYCPMIAGNQNGNGWQMIAVRNLIPEEYWDPAECRFTSPNQKNLARHEANRVLKSLDLEDVKSGAIYADVPQASNEPQKWPMLITQLNGVEWKTSDGERFSDFDQAYAHQSQCDKLELEE